jgi:hypothetical protein
MSGHPPAREDERDPYDVASAPPWEDYAYAPEELLEIAADYEAQVIEEGIRDQSLDRARRYLSTNGDAVWLRVDRCLREAALLQAGHPGPSIVVCMTGTELLVRYLLLRPLLAGLIFHDGLAVRLIHDPFRNRQRLDRELLPITCRAWSLDLEGLTLANGVPIWFTLLELWNIRNHAVHRAREVSEAQALGALDCTRGLVDQLLVPLARQVRLKWPDGPWSRGGRRRDPVEEDFEYLGS